MNKKELIERLIQNENSPYSEVDVKELNALTDDMLRKIVLSIPPVNNTTVQQRDVPVKNDDADELSRKAIMASQQALKKVQKQIYELRVAESKVLDDLDALGATEKSIFNIDHSKISDEDIHLFVQNSQSEVAQVLREALELRNHGRIELVAQVIANSGGLFSEDDLRCKTSEELRKLAALAGGNTQQASFGFHGAMPMQLRDRDGGAMDWRGAGIGNIPIMNEVGGGAPLNLPTTLT